MKGYLASVRAEIIKVLKSKIFLLTFVFFIFIVCIMGLMMLMVKNPELMQKMGMLGTKAEILALKPDWTNYLSLLNQVIMTGGLIGFGFVAIWIFGREYSDRTLKDLLALPVSRHAIVLSKMTVMAIWCVLLSAVILFLGLGMGRLVGLENYDRVMINEWMKTFAILIFFIVLLNAPVAFFATFGKGFLPPLAFLIVMVILAQVAGVIGKGEFFPWTIPAMYCGAMGPDGIAALKPVSWVIFYGTTAAGLAGTLLWQRFADQT